MAENIKIPQFAINGQIYDILDKETSEGLAQLSSYVGTPNEGKTIVQMISDGDNATLNSAKEYTNGKIGDIGSGNTVASALNALNSEITSTINPQITALNNKIGQIGSTSVAEALNTLNTQITNDITTNINTVIDKVKFNEKVTAIAMTDLHRQIQDIEENVNYIINNGISTTSGSSSSGSDWDGATHHIYYGTLSEELTLSNISSLQHKSAKNNGYTSLSNINIVVDPYFYICTENGVKGYNYRINSIMSTSGEPIVYTLENDNFNYNGGTYNVYKIEADNRLQITINITISKIII